MNTSKLHKTVNAVEGIFDISSTATDVTLKEGHFKGKKLKPHAHLQIQILKKL